MKYMFGLVSKTWSIAGSSLEKRPNGHQVETRGLPNRGPARISRDSPGGGNRRKGAIVMELVCTATPPCLSLPVSVAGGCASTTPPPAAGGAVETPPPLKLAQGFTGRAGKETASAASRPPYYIVAATEGVEAGDRLPPPALHYPHHPTTPLLFSVCGERGDVDAAFPPSRGGRQREPFFRRSRGQPQGVRGRVNLPRPTCRQSGGWVGGGGGGWVGRRDPPTCPTY